MMLEDYARLLFSGAAAITAMKPPFPEYYSLCKETHRR